MITRTCRLERQMNDEENCETCAGRVNLGMYVVALFCLALMTVGGLVTIVLVSMPSGSDS